MTLWPALSSWSTQWPARNPVAPVTSVVGMIVCDWLSCSSVSWSACLCYDSCVTTVVLLICLWYIFVATGAFFIP
ncbi:hypothetical protein B0I72DRAFT_142144 [Yarrowia lipolytica]|uniref:Uncharacterized protein n=1 Tax=Yarrowia lipolytica TaxID=4952 RepID=A0A371BZ20_YARLL|nr:hypothetical protein B0I71DRAFT_136110 [Yarrowia lipolytica]RDW30082.1 hypothetical protein B0I72DRAFT_142144 [Yarrowia lipolytica]RDW39769.1 hypothetical protein B0I73DRAFT_131411 [Yarrowia lipolytica]RDW47151.1 hypothetical protein B0I74DRAFT_135819 [Yarrowia lipolytica]RDW53378.1 hypothetical protein B0I75DRAFT_136485 [Yarrowia lipolytica]